MDAPPDPPTGPGSGGSGFTVARRLFLRLLGLIYFTAFASLAVQVLPLMGSRGLAPVAELLDPGPTRDRWSEVTLYRPTLFHLGHSDAWLVGAAVLGAAIGLLLAAGLAPGPCALALWFLYLSFVTVDRAFLGFQWDNLLLETGLLALLVAPWRIFPRSWRARAPSRVAVFLFHFLVFRLNFESGLCKLLTGDPTWRGLTAMDWYYETAPIPTALGWQFHNLPHAWHATEVVMTFFVELLAAALVFGPRLVRLAAFAPLLGLQIVIAATANYGPFNFLSAALLVFLIDDETFGRVGALAARIRGPRPATAPEPSSSSPSSSSPNPHPPPRLRLHPALRRIHRFWYLPPVAFYAAMTYGAFFEVFVPPLEPGERAGEFRPFRRVHDFLITGTGPARRLTDPLRSINRYHLFGTMTIDRYEVGIEGSDDGETWKSYEFAYKAGDPERRPRRAAPFHPRLDFQCWFLLLRPRSLTTERFEAALADPRYLARVTRSQPWFETLLVRLLTDPPAVAPLLAEVPFGESPPRLLRVRVDRYTMTTRDERRRTGAWWNRQHVATWGPFGPPRSDPTGR